MYCNLALGHICNDIEVIYMRVKDGAWRPRGNLALQIWSILALKVLIPMLELYSIGRIFKDS
jgi:hypothetical protein